TTGRTPPLTSCGSLPWCFHLLGSGLRCQGIWVLGQFSNCGIAPIRMMWLRQSRKLLLSPGARRLFPRNGHPSAKMVNIGRDGLPGRGESLNRVRQLQFSVPSWPDVRERGEDVLREDVDRHDRVIAPRSLRFLDRGPDPEDAWLQCVALDHAIGAGMGHIPQEDRGRP